MPDILEMLTAERDKLNRAIEALSVGIGTTLGRMVRIKRIATEGTGRSKMSAATRARMAAGQRGRWAKAKGQSAVATPAKKFTMSPAARAKIAKAQKARWAKIRAGK